MKKTSGAVLLLVTLTVSLVLLCRIFIGHKNLIELYGTIESLADSENWEGKKLKMVNCQCKTKGNKGHTLKCVDDGTLESCSATQQGLNGCYGLHAFPPSGELLCEGDDVIILQK